MSNDSRKTELFNPEKLAAVVFPPTELLMINNKAASKKKEPQPKASHSADQRLEVNGQSKLFKKLSMSFYNWATKNRDKQVVCDAYEQPQTVELCTSTGSLDTKKKSLRKKPKPKPKKEPEPVSNQPQPTTEGKHHYNEYYFQGVSKLPKVDKAAGYRAPPHYDQSNYTQSGPREITQIYFRRYVDQGATQTQQSFSVQRSSRSSKRKRSKKPGKSRSKEPKLKGIVRKTSERQLKSPRNRLH